MNLEIKLDHPQFLPTRAHSWDAGLDLKSTVNALIAPNEVKTIDTGVAIKVPKGYVGLVFSRSSQGKQRVSLANAVGVIDESYRGNIKVMLHNDAGFYYEIKRFDRIAQLVIMPIEIPQLMVHDGTEEAWNDTIRGTNGFGSTGVQ